MIDISDKILSIDPFSDPFARRLEWKLRKSLVCIQSKRQTVMLDLFKIIESLGPSFKSKIKDPLSEYVNASQMPRIQKSYNECLIVEEFHDKYKYNEIFYLRLSALIIDIRNDLEDRYNYSWNFRTFNISTRPDSKGNFTNFPKHQLIDEYLRHMEIRSAINMKTFPFLTACYAMVSIIAVHPFIDGNGRTARVTFNLILRQILSRSIYIPIYEVAACSDGGWMLALRRAWLHNNFEPIVKLLCNTARVIL